MAGLFARGLLACAPPSHVAGLFARGLQVRYSAVRKQGFAEQGAGFGAAELPVLDYTLQQYRLLPLLCTYAAYCFGALDPSTVYLD